MKDQFHCLHLKNLYNVNTTAAGTIWTSIWAAKLVIDLRESHVGLLDRRRSQLIIVKSA